MLVKDAAKDAAEKALKKHWDGVLPVNPVAIAESLGIDVQFATFSDELSGAIVAEDGDIKILLSDDDSLSRQIFTCAHELGHFFERREAKDNDYSFSDLTPAPVAGDTFEEGRGGAWDLHEFYADEFAANLLMPADKFVPLFRQEVGVGTLADIFAVSRAAVQSRIRRLRKEGLIEARAI